MSEDLKLPRCTNCQALQIKVIRFYYENCHYCGSENKQIRFKEIKGDKDESKVVERRKKNC